MKVLVGSGFAYNQADPGQVFLDVKTADYPWKIFAGRIMFIGGQWINKAWETDVNPRETYVREVLEEISFSRPKISTEEMAVLCPLVTTDSYIAPAIKGAPTAEDERHLTHVKASLVDPAHMCSFGDYHIRTPASLIQTLQPEYSGTDLTAVFSIFAVGLPPDEWDMLCDLQARFENLSNESQSVVTSLKRILAGEIAFASGYDQIMQDFWIFKGLPGVEGMPTQKGVEVVRMGLALGSYRDYLARYDVEKRPPVTESLTPNLP